MKLKFRQGLVRCQTDNNNNPLFLQRTGHAVSLVVSPTPTIVTFAHTDTDYLYTEGKNVPSAWLGPFLADKDYWLYWDLNIITGLRTFGHTLRAPITSRTPPAQPLVDQHWFDLNTTSMRVWNGNVWNTVIRVFACKYALGTVFETMLKPLSKQFTGSQVSLNVPCKSGALIFDTVGKPLKTSTNTFFTTETGAAVSGFASAINIASLFKEGEAQEVIPAYSMVYFSGFHKLKRANNNTSPLIPVGMVETALTPGQVGQMVTEGLVVSDQWNWTTVNQPLYIGVNGELTVTQMQPDQGPIAFVMSPDSVMIIRTQLSRGDRGNDGVIGVDGADGAPGPIGPQGLPGDQGEVGPEGPIGPQGIPGNDGADGSLNAVARAGDEMTGALILHADPMTSMQAATKQYADSVSTGHLRIPCRVGSKTALTLYGSQVVDNVVVVVGDRVLVKNQSGNGPHKDNGIYIVTNGEWTRAGDAATSQNMVTGMIVYISEGSTQAGQAFVVSTVGNIFVGTTPIQFISFNNSQVIVLSGAAGGSGTTSIPVTLTNSGVIPGSYTQVTVNTAGQVTYGQSPSTIAGYGITNAVNKQGDSMSGFLQLVADPILGDHAATKNYVDTRTSGPGFITAGGLAFNANSLSVVSVSQNRIVVNPGTIDLALTGVSAGTYNSVTVDGYGRITAGSSVGNSQITLSGDATGSGTSAINVQLSSTGVTAGTYTQVTVDVKGRITTGSAPTTLAGFGITDAIKKTGDTMTGNLVMGTSDTVSASNRWIQRVRDPVNPQDVATKNYVDTATGAVLTPGNGLAFEGNLLNIVPVSTNRIVVAPGTIDLATSGAAAGTYQQVTVDVYGRVTSGANPPLVNANITLSGDVSGSGTSAIAVTLANSGVSAGANYTKFTVNSKGIVTAAATPTTFAGLGLVDGLDSLSDVVLTTPSSLQVLTYNGANWINSSPAQATDKLVATSSTDTTPGYLHSKLALTPRFSTSITSPSGNETFAVDLATTGVTAGGPYNTFNVDAYGRITVANNTSGSNQPITLSGDATGTGSTAITVALSNTGVPAGTYTKVTVDAKGRVTSAANPTTMSGYGLTDAQPLNGFLSNISTGNAGIVAKNSTSAYFISIVGTAGRINVTNGVGYNGNPTIDLASGVIPVAGTYTKLTVDTYGRVIAGQTITTSDVGGLGTIAGQNANNVTLTGGSVTNTKVLPRISTVAYAANVNIDWATADIVRVVLTGNINITNIGAGPGQKCILELIQDATGGRTVTFTTETRFGTDITGFTASTGANKLDRIGFIYSEIYTTYDVVAVIRGF
jgi:phage-related tail fiber protein